MIVPSIAQKLMRWTVTGPFGSEMRLYKASVEHYVVAPDIGAPFCRSHDAQGPDCQEAVNAVIAARLNDSITKE